MDRPGRYFVHFNDDPMKSNMSGVLVALLAGAVLGVLLAPRSGRATRQKFGSDTDRFLRDLQDTIASGFENIRSQYEDTVDSVKSRYNEATDVAASRSKSATK